MKLSHDMFAIKLYELEQEYDQMRSRLYLCRQDDHDKIRAELEQITQELQRREFILKQSVDSCQSPAVAALSALQAEYSSKAQELLRQKLPGYLHGESTSIFEAQAEASTLYAEYAIDFATLSMKCALQAVLSAIDRQMSCEEAQ